MQARIRAFDHAHQRAVGLVAQLTRNGHPLGDSLQEVLDDLLVQEAAIVELAEYPPPPLFVRRCVPTPFMTPSEQAAIRDLADALQVAVLTVSRVSKEPAAQETLTIALSRASAALTQLHP